MSKVYQCVLALTGAVLVVLGMGLLGAYEETPPGNPTADLAPQTNGRCVNGKVYSWGHKMYLNGEEVPCKNYADQG